jgi:hypothetical protein
MTQVLSQPTAALRDLLRHTDPVASVYFGLRPPFPAENLDLRRHALVTRLADAGADEPTRTAVAARLAAAGPEPGELAVFAAGGHVLLAQPIPGGASFDRAGYAAPAAVVPLLDWWQRHPAHVVVVTDRTGADVVAVPRGAARGTASVVIGPDDEIERNAPGGWAQPRYQRRAEDSWRHNAAAVAAATARALREHSAGLVLVAGDVRAAQLLRDDLAPLVHQGLTVRQLPGGRAPDGSAANRAAAITREVAGYAAHQIEVALAALGRHAGPGGTAVQGARATIAALGNGEVQTLFVAEHAGDDRLAWFGPDVLCAAEPAAGTAPGRLVDVAVRAALLTDAEVRVVAPGAVPGDIAALRRFPIGAPG